MGHGIVRSYSLKVSIERCRGTLFCARCAGTHQLMLRKKEKKEVSKIAEKKYAKHIIPAPISKTAAEGHLGESLHAHEGELNADCSIGFQYVTEPFSEHGPHTHEGHQILCFVGGDLRNIREFDAAVQIKLGEEGEIHTMTSPSVVSIPPGLVHCPLTFKRNTRP
jgi:hypothetical protein